MRYSRQLVLPEIGVEGQAKLQAAKVLLVGVGGLGSPIALYLAAAGVGTLGLVDGDVVSLSNLQRQVLYTEDNLGERKATAAARRLLALNSEMTVNACPYALQPGNARSLISHYDLVVDGCDNFATRYLMDDTCAALNLPYVYGAITGFEGQVSVFHYGTAARSYRQLYPSPPAEAPRTEPDAAARGVMGVTPAVVGSMETNEVLKIIGGYGDVLSGKLWTIDLRTVQTNIFSL
ncbi:MAG: HesA/MoeB/ThiF family protein [Bacteroides sp.]